MVYPPRSGGGSDIYGRFRHNNPLIRRKTEPMICTVDVSTVPSKPSTSVDFFDVSTSGRTVDADASSRSVRGILEPIKPRYKSCMKVHTQRDSLAQISETCVLPNTYDAPHDPHRPTPVPSSHQMVRFDTVEVREYERKMSDNPWTSSGPAIGIGWRYDPRDIVTVDLDEYESGRDGLRRTKPELAIPATVRERMLLEVGYSRHEISKAAKAARKEKGRRAASVQNQKFDPIIERVDSLKRGLRRIGSVELLRIRSTADSPHRSGSAPI